MPNSELPTDSTNPVAAEPRRLFIALWLDAGLQGKLHALGGELLGNCSMRCSTSAIPGVVTGSRGRRIPQENLHITLAFLGSVDVEHQACLERVASTIQTPAFTLTLDQAGFWPRKGILWAGGTPPDRAARAGARAPSGTGRLRVRTGYAPVPGACHASRATCGYVSISGGRPSVRGNGGSANSRSWRRGRYRRARVTKS